MILPIITRLSLHPVTGDEMLADIGVDDLGKVTIANDLEVALGLEPIPDATIARWVTVADIMQTVGDQL